jgi:S1-C subfamily serine protease
MVRKLADALCVAGATDKTPLVLLTCAALMVSACGSGKEDEKLKETQWRKQSMALSVEGFQFAGGEAKPAAWFGSGVFITPDIIVTNAHVARRGLKITGQDDMKRPNLFTKILAMDQGNDIALLKADYVPGDIKPAELIARPQDPLDLRQTEVFAAGNTGGLGLSTYDGRVVNVVDYPYGERIMHDGQIAGGSSGGPLFRKQDRMLIGVNHAGDPRLKFSIAIPVWYVSDLLTKAGKTGGKPLAEAFRIGETTQLLNPIQKQGCLAPGKAITVPMVYMQSLDFAIQIAPQNQAKPLVYGLLVTDGKNSEVMEKGVVAQPALRVISAPVSAQYVLVLGAPENAQGETCLQFTVGQIDWDKMINPK